MCVNLIMSSNPVFNFDGSGAVNFTDYVIMAEFFAMESGPSAVGFCP